MLEPVRKIAVRRRSGFTLVELVIVMAVISILLSTIIPNLYGMQTEGQLSIAEHELNTLKIAIVSYWRNHDNIYPPDITQSLTNAVPTVILPAIGDPWRTDPASGTYGYVIGTDPVFGDYFIVYTKGPKADTLPTFDATSQNIVYSGSGRVASNAPVVKQ